MGSVPCFLQPCTLCVSTSVMAGFERKEGVMEGELCYGMQADSGSFDQPEHLNYTSFAPLLIHLQYKVVSKQDP